MTSITHPLPLGTIIRVSKPHKDTGTMSWDDSDTEIERVAPAGATCTIIAIEGNTPCYHVEFLPSEVWNILDPSDFNDYPDDYQIVELGNGEKPKAHDDYYANPNRERDPEAERKIAEELAANGPSI